MKKLQTIALCMLIMFMSCDKDDSPSNNNPDPDPSAFAENFGSEIQRNFLGKVIDTNHNPIQNVTITIGNKTAQTDANGIFIISDANLYQRFGYIKAEKAGYLHGSRSIVPSEGTNKVTIMLLEETVVGTTNSGTTETITLPYGASVALQGEYVKEDGAVYSGSVNVIMHHLDPADEDMQDQMPGMLYAANAENEERMLQTFGMLAVELRGSGGEILNLADGSSAEIKVPLDASLLADAPSTIPLWHFDETHGYLVEDGQATLVGNAYVGTVTHFSFWNCDIPFETVNFCVTVLDSNGMPLSNLYVNITSDIYGTRGGQTNENGEVCGLVPKNETLDISVLYISACGYEYLHEGIVGPFNDDTTITVNANDNGTYITQTVTGSFTSCNGNPVSDGYVGLHYNGVEFSEIITDGTFEFNLISCNTNSAFNLQGYDYVNSKQTDSIAYTFTTPITNIGTLSACDDYEEFITYQVDDHPPITFNFDVTGGLDGDTGGVLSFYVYSNNQQNFFEISISNFDGIGSYSNSTYLSFYDENGDATSLETQFEGVTNISTFGGINEYVDINFSGNLVFWNSTDVIPISGTLHVKQDY